MMSNSDARKRQLEQVALCPCDQPNCSDAGLKTTPTVSGTFYIPCLKCGSTVEIVDTVTQPHDCERGSLAHAYWQGHDRAVAALAQRDAQIRAEALDACATLLAKVVTYWDGRPLSTGHGVHLYADVRDVLRGIERDRDHNRAIARQSVEGGGERG